METRIAEEVGAMSRRRMPISPEALGRLHQAANDEAAARRELLDKTRVLRDAVQFAAASGGSVRAIAQEVRLTPNTIQRWLASAGPDRTESSGEAEAGDESSPAVSNRHAAAVAGSRGVVAEDMKA